MTSIQDTINSLHLLSAEDQKERIREILLSKHESLRGAIPDYRFFETINVKLLIVADGQLNYTITDGYGLGYFLKAIESLNRDPEYNIKLDLTLAHRSTCFIAPGYDTIQNYKFRDIDSFDQIWLFGQLQTNDPLGLDQSEVRLIEKFLRDGKGVFATGDHATMGCALGGRIPVLQELRDWFSTKMDKQNRNDTNRPRSGQTVSDIAFSNQSDDTPQTIDPVIYDGYVHQILDSKIGIIRVMPDHPHEGQTQMGKNITVKNADGTELFTRQSKVISNSNVLSGVTSSGKESTLSKSFPSITVFDGHEDSYGRIVVNSTWHHFTNLNLIPNAIGGAGLRKKDLEYISQFYKNIVIWLLDVAKTETLFNRIFFGLLQDSNLVEAALDMPKQYFVDLSNHELISIGTLAYEGVSDQYSKAFSKAFVDYLFKKHIQPTVQMLDTINTGGLIDKGNCMNLVLGSAIYFLNDKHGEKIRSNKYDEEITKDMIVSVSDGLTAGVDRLNSSFSLLLTGI